MLGWAHGGKGPNGDGVFKLREGEGVLADRLVIVHSRLPAAPYCEVIELDVLEVSNLADGICGWSWINCSTDSVLGVEHIGPGFFAFGLLLLFFSFLLGLSLVGIFLILCQPVLVFLFEAVLLDLSVPHYYLAVIFLGPSFLNGEGNV